MRAQDIFAKNLKTYLINLRLRQPGYTQQLHTTVQARTPEMARRMVRAQYGESAVLVGQPRELK